jgi:putative membrane protein
VSDAGHAAGASEGGGAEAGGAAAGADASLYHERTRLAWRRTGLALLGATLAVGRLSFDTLGVAVVVPTVVGVALAGWAVARTARRGHGPVLTDGRIPAVLAAVAVLLAGVEVAAAVLRA